MSLKKMEYLKELVNSYGLEFNQSRYYYYRRKSLIDKTVTQRLQGLAYVGIERLSHHFSPDEIKSILEITSIEDIIRLCNHLDKIKHDFLR